MRVAASVLLLTFGGCDWLHTQTKTTANPPSEAQSGKPESTAPQPIVMRTAPRTNGPIQPQGSGPQVPPRLVFGETPKTPVLSGDNSEPNPGEMSLNYADADIREVARVILGNMLKVPYTIDPAVHGTVTVQTAQPVSRDALVPLLENLLAQNGAALTVRDGVYRVLPSVKAGAEGAAPSEAPIGTGTEVVPLHYAVAKDLAKVLLPYVSEGSRITPAEGANALLVTGSSDARLSLIDLIRTFDVDFLAGQSYAIFPVKSEDPAKVAAELQQFIRAAGGGAEDAVNVLPLARINAVLVVARQPAYLERIARYLGQVDSVGEKTRRQLYVYYVQNGLATDLAPLLQKAFAPGSAAPDTSQSPLAPNVTPTSVTSNAPGTPGPAPAAAGAQPPSTLSGTLSGNGGFAQPATSQPGTGGLGQMPGQAPSPSFGSQQQGPSPDLVVPAEPDTSAPTHGLRIIPDKKNNALLIYATPDEYSSIEAALRKVDVLPLQVLVDATIAEVTLNDALQYGTQWFFQKGKVNVSLSSAVAGGVAPTFPGFNFLISGSNIQTALSALESVTTVKIVSAPELVVLDNEKAHLQVGNLVPIITQSAVSVATAGAPVVNSVDYRETGVILEVQPRVNSGGLVTLDIAQEVSDVLQTTSSTINSPTFSERQIRTRVIVHDGETIGLGGLIKDSDTVTNSGFPWLTDVPVLGALFGTRSNSAVRTELLVLLTPHVIHDQRDVRALTDELKQRLGRLAAQPVFHDPIEPPGPLRSQEK